MNANGCKLGVIIVAGGSGSRMQSDTPKQFLKIMDVYILECTLKTLLPLADEVVVVLPHSQRERWNQIIAEKGLEGTHKMCDGGATRFESVQNGLAMLGECDLVAIHDGVRPLVSRQMVERGIETASKHGSAIPTIGAIDSFRVEDEQGVLHVMDRSKLRAIQTPQIFKAELIREAYMTSPTALFTDDATVVERLGVTLAYYEGERANIKITTPEDLVIAEALLAATTFKTDK